VIECFWSKWHSCDLWNGYRR